jgi:hypothetical protein
VEVMMNHFLADIDDGSQKGKRTAFLLRKLVSEAVEEMGEIPPEMMEFYFKRAAAMMYWAATGERIVNIPLPPSFVPDSELERKDVGTMSEVDTASFMALEAEEYVKARAEGQRREMAALEARDDDE